MRRTAALIVGGGPAGAATAIGLALGGVRAVVLERQAETADAICGGFLSWATLGRLARIGIDAGGLGAMPIDRLCVLARGGEAEAMLPAAGAALSRRVLDRALLARAEALGVGVERGVRVRAIEDGSVALADGGALAAERIVLATGKHDLRGHRRVDPGAVATLGVRWRLEATPLLARLVGGRIELHLFEGGYAGLVLQEGGSANLCLAVRKDRWDAEGGRPERLLAALARELPALGARLDAAGAVGPADTIANVPYGWRAPAGELYRVGDQAAVIPSLAGEGIAIALASGEAAARAILSGEDARGFHRPLARRLRQPLAVAGQVWRLAERPFWAGMLVGCMRAAPRSATMVARLTRV